MDLVTLVAMCSISFDPEVMRSLIWRQSQGRPWSFSVASDTAPQTFDTLREAVASARAAQAGHATIRVGLTGLEVDLKAATAEPNEAMFAMCPNVTIASERLRRLQDRCAREAHFNADPTWCALAVWRGSWEQPDSRFADAVMLGVALGDVPNPELPSESDIGSSARDHDRAARKAKRDPATDAAFGSGLFAPSRDARQPSKASHQTPDGMFVRRGHRQ
jgi:hypothetical protein